MWHSYESHPETARRNSDRKFVGDLLEILYNRAIHAEMETERDEDGKITGLTLRMAPSQLEEPEWKIQSMEDLEQFGRQTQEVHERGREVTYLDPQEGALRTREEFMELAAGRLAARDPEKAPLVIHGRNLQRPGR